MGIVKTGASNGVKVVIGQLASRKVAGVLNSVLPASLTGTAMGGIAARAGAAVVTAMVARKFAPRHAEFVTAGAFAELITFALAQNATTAKFLSGYTQRPVAVRRGAGGRVSAWPGRPAMAAGVSAWPGRPVGMPTVVGQ